MRSRIIYFILFCALLMFGNKARAEVIQLTLYWDALSCNEICIQLLRKNFSTIYGVSDMMFDQSAGKADLYWKPNAPLDYNAVNTARKMVGIGLTEIRVKVRGVLSVNNGQFTLTSLGDNSYFNLLAPVIMKDTQYLSKYHRFAVPFPPEKNQQLMDAIKNNAVVTIEGQLYYPYRGPPLELIAQYIKVEDRDFR